MAGLGQNSKTLNVDTLFVRDIYFRDFANNPIPANLPFVSRGDGGTYFTSSFASTIALPAINAITAPLEAGGNYTFAPLGIFNTFILNPGAGVEFYSNSSNGGLGIYTIGPEQIIADGQVLPFTSLPDYTVGGRTLQYIGTGDTYLHVSDATIFFNSVYNSSISTIIFLQSTTTALENQLNSSIATLNSLATSTGLFNYNLISSYFLTPDVINISTVSTSLLVLGDNTIRDIPLRDSIYDPCIVYTASTVLSTNTDFLTFTDNFSGVTFAIDKEYLYAASTLFYGPSTTTVTRGEQVQLGWFPSLSTQTDSLSLRAQFVPVVQQLQVMEQLVSTGSYLGGGLYSTITNYYMKNIGKFDEICNPTQILLTSPVIAATVRKDNAINNSWLQYNSNTNEVVWGNNGGTGTLPMNAENYGDYIYWNGVAWVVGFSTISIGDQAGGDGLQGEAAIAVGAAAGNFAQGLYAVAVGYTAGQNNQGETAIAIGNAAGNSNQGSNTVAIGNYAGGTIQGDLAIAIGNYAGYSNQQRAGVAVGYYAGEFSQGSNAVAIGLYAGQYNQHSNSVAIGNEAGNLNQQKSAVAIGDNAGSSQSSFGIAIGLYAGFNQDENAVAIGSYAGYNIQNSNTVAIGNYAGGDVQDAESIAIGDNAGVTQSSFAVAIGYYAGNTHQGKYAVAIGASAGYSTQGAYAVAIGFSAGQDAQGSNTVAVGWGAGQSNQGSQAVAIGQDAGQNAQGDQAVAIGQNAGTISQGSNAVAIGLSAGRFSQSSNAIAIGYAAGSNNQSTNTIVINATGVALNTIYDNSLYIAPIRSDISVIGNGLSYNVTTGEIVYNAAKTFVINHPKDESKYLVHACLEGPEAGVYYRGTGTIADLESSVVIELPDYVDSLAVDFTVQVTPVYNGAVRILNASCVSNNRFIVYGDSGDFFWHVYGRRAAIVVEPKKSDVELHGEGPYRWIG